MSPSMAARRNNNPGLADLLDSEARLRGRDTTRVPRLRSGGMTEKEFNETLKAEEAMRRI